MQQILEIRLDKIAEWVQVARMCSCVGCKTKTQLLALSRYEQEPSELAIRFRRMHTHSSVFRSWLHCIAHGEFGYCPSMAGIDPSHEL